MSDRISKLLTVKSIVTLMLTAVFSYLAVKGDISKDFMTVYAVIIAFYYGTQTTKENTTKENNDGKTD
jgi:5-bromo-4-chloroindolyl phosphate hydrolysis protein